MTLLRINTLGGLSIAGATAAPAGAGGRPKPLALLALLAAAGERGISRDKLLSYLWPESDAERARTVLRQTLYSLRRDLAAPDLVLGTTRLRLNPEVASSDVAEFEGALDSGELERAVALYGGAFLDGFHIGNTPDFERWVEDERRRHEQRARIALESLANGADRRGDFRAAIEWWRQLAALDPYSSRVTLGLMRALASSGDPGAAFAHARIHEQRLREDLDCAPDPAVALLLDEISSVPQPSAIPPAAVVPTAVGVPQAPGPARSDAAGRSVPRRSTRKRVHLGFAVGLVAVGISIVGVIGRSPRAATAAAPDGESRAEAARERLDSTVVAVMPFNVAVSDSSHAYLREGMVDLLATRFAGEGGSRAADPRSVIDAWRRATKDGGSRPDAARDVARLLGAGQLLTGGIVGNSSRLTISAALVTTSDGRVRADAVVEGSADSITGLVDRLAAILLARRAGEVEPRLSSLMSTSLPALKAYLAGQASYRLGRFDEAARHFGQAVEHDSTFALAALQLGFASGWARRPGHQQGHALRLAWSMRDRLSQRDRDFLALFMAPFSPERVDIIAMAERVVAADPDRPQVWYDYGDRLMHSGWALEIDSAHDRAAAAFRRALDLDSRYVPAMTHLLQLVARAGDSAAVRRLAGRHLEADSDGELVPFVRWRLALSSGDTSWLARLRSSFDAAPPTSLLYILQTGLHDGVGIDDAQAAADALVHNATTREERLDALLGAHALAVSRGLPAKALAITEALAEQDHASRTHLRLRVTDALYDAGDSAAAAGAVAELARFADAAPVSGAEQRADQYKDMCVVEQWRLANGSSEGTRRAIDLLRAWDPPVGSNVGYGNAVCALLLDAVLAQSEGGVVASSAVERLEASLASAPGIDEMLAYAPIALARLHEAQGDPAAALRAIRRRFYFAFWPHYLRTHLREESRLAALVGDWPGAQRAQRHYLALASRSEAGAATDDLRMDASGKHGGRR